MTFKEAITKAITENCKVEIYYEKYNNESSKRELSNLEYSNEFQNYGYVNDHITAYCHLREETRTFKLERIEKIRLLTTNEQANWITNPSFVSTTYSSIKTTRNSKAKGCYIATMAYGNYEHPKVKILRKFRDEILQNHFLGRIFIKFYYFISPNLVIVLKNHTKINAIIRKILDKFITYIN